MSTSWVHAHTFQNRMASAKLGTRKQRTFLPFIQDFFTQHNSPTVSQQQQQQLISSPSTNSPTSISSHHYSPPIYHHHHHHHYPFTSSTLPPKPSIHPHCCVLFLYTYNRLLACRVQLNRFTGSESRLGEMKRGEGGKRWWWWRWWWGYEER